MTYYNSTTVYYYSGNLLARKTVLQYIHSLLVYFLSEFYFQDLVLKNIFEYIFKK